MKVETVKVLTPVLVQSQPQKIFVFGDNMAGWGKGGQACIRDLPNAFGIPTKRSPYEYFSGQPDEFAAVNTSINELLILSNRHTIVFPKDGVGTGLANLKARSPEIWKFLCDRLKEDFGFMNGTGEH